MTAEDKIEKISKVSSVEKTTLQTIDDVQEPVRLAPNKERFDNLMSNEIHHTQQQDKQVGKIEPVSKSSLMDEVRNINTNVNNLSRVSSRDLVAQADKVVNQIESIKHKLATPDLKINNSTQTLLQNKLSHIDENLRVAMSKAGLEYSPAEQAQNKSVNPIERFLGFLTNGQSQLNNLSTEINTMHLNNKEISPANMLRIQMKVGYITQEIEFFTAVLNKALDSTKTIMNVQV